MDFLGKLETVTADGHVHVRQQDIHVEPGLHENQRLGRVGGLYHSETSLLEKLGDEQADERLIFD